MPWNVFTQSSAFTISGDQLAIELFIQCQNYEKISRLQDVKERILNKTIFLNRLKDVLGAINRGYILFWD